MHYTSFFVRKHFSLTCTLLCFVIVIGNAQVMRNAQKQFQQQIRQQKNSLVRHVEAYKLGDRFHIQCKHWYKDEWTSGPVCSETGEEISFLYGIDFIQRCDWSVNSSEMLSHLRKLLTREGLFRVPLW